MVVFLKVNPLGGAFGVVLTTFSTTFITQSISFVPKYIYLKILRKEKVEIKEIIIDSKPKETKRIYPKIKK